MSIANLTALNAIDTSALIDGSRFFVETCGDFFTLNKTSSLRPKANVVVAATFSGVWVRDFTPTQQWLTYNDFYVDPLNGNDENSGIAPTSALQSFDEFQRRVVVRFANSTNANATCHILNDIHEAINIAANWGALGPGILTIDGFSSRVGGIIETVAAVLPANPIPTAATTIAVGSNGQSLPQATIHVASTTGFTSGNPKGVATVVTDAGAQTVNYSGTSGGNTLTGCTGGTGAMLTGNAVAQAPNEWRISIAAFDFSTYVDAYFEVTSGANVTDGFFILADLGNGSAIISEPHSVLSYTFAGSGNVSPGDPIQLFTLKKFGDTLTIEGPGLIAFQQLQIGAGALHDVQFYGCYNAFIDTCSISSYDAVSGAVLSVGGTFTSSNIHAYRASEIVLQHGGSRAGITCHTGSLVTIEDFTCIAGTIAGQGRGNYEVDGWLCTSLGGGIALDPGCQFECYGTSYVFGTGVGGTKITLSPGAGFYFLSGHAPFITGFGGNDSLIGGTAKAFSAWPYVESTNLAQAVVRG